MVSEKLLRAGYAKCYFSAPHLIYGFISCQNFMFLKPNPKWGALDGHKKSLSGVGVHQIVICRIPDNRILPDNFWPDTKPDIRSRIPGFI